jgi:ribonuclease P protein component
VKREWRLRRGNEIERVRNTGRSWPNGPIVLLAAPQPGEPTLTRCAFITGKKIGGAVERNLARRRMREALRAVYPQIMPGWDLVLIARPSIQTSDFRRISAAVAEALRRARLLTSASGPGGPSLRADHEMAHPAADPPVPGDL